MTFQNFFQHVFRQGFITIVFYNVVMTGLGKVLFVRGGAEHGNYGAGLDVRG